MWKASLELIAAESMQFFDGQFEIFRNSFQKHLISVQMERKGMKKVQVVVICLPCILFKFDAIYSGVLSEVWVEGRRCIAWVRLCLKQQTQLGFSLCTISILSSYFRSTIQLDEVSFVDKTF